MTYFPALTCMMPGCTADLFLRVTAGIDLFEDVFTPETSSPSLAKPGFQFWAVECQDGHVVLVPGPSGCPCEAGKCEPACPGYEYDWSEEVRTFRTHDATRLKQLIGQLRSATQHVIEFRADGWTIQHPIACRPALFDCPLNRLAETELREPPPAFGRFEVSINDMGDRLLIGDRVDEHHVREFGGPKPGA